MALVAAFDLASVSLRALLFSILGALRCPPVVDSTGEASLGRDFIMHEVLLCVFVGIDIEATRD